MQAAIVNLYGTSYLNVWTDNGSIIGSICFYHDMGAGSTNAFCDTGITNSYELTLDQAGDADVLVWSVAGLNGTADCSTSDLSDCVEAGGVRDLVHVSTSTPGYQLSSSVTFTSTTAATTSTSSPPSYNNVISSDGLIIGGLLLCVIILLAWRRS